MISVQVDKGETMDNTREKLIELLQSSPADIMGNHGVGAMADHLIANGVTVQKWIPVTERLPKKITNKVVVLCENGYRGFGHYEDYKGKQTWYNLESDKPFTDWDYGEEDSYKVTHWMPLPQPPKEG
jgi:hypothetical protein